ncbi:hypothetical protein MTO96_016196 [Rhipicephalus appendiculatus]
MRMRSFILRHRRLSPTARPSCTRTAPVARREFHYRASVNACLATALDPMVQLCARGFNRFASRATCEHSCVFGYRPKDACFETPLFSGCEREDVSESWWYFESGRCQPWSFPAGACPSNDSALFSTAAECDSRCAGRGSALCGQAPRPTACSRNQLRFPYFAHFAEPEGRMRCLRASAVLEAAHRCLGRRQPLRVARRLHRGLRGEGLGPPGPGHVVRVMLCFQLALAGGTGVRA